MTEKHTPGPWHYDGDAFIYGHDYGEESQTLIAEVFDDPDGANARLIAATPELLEAAEELVATAELTETRATIAKIKKNIKKLTILIQKVGNS
jgi:DNA-binding ferritin-like protein